MRIIQAGARACLVFFVLAGCQIGGLARSAGWATPTANGMTSTPTAHSQATYSAQGDPAANGSRRPPQVHVATATPAPTTVPEAPRAEYHLAARVDYDRHFVQVTQEVTYPNQTGAALEALVLVVESNRTAGVFHLDTLQWEDGSPVANYTLDGVRLSVPLPTALRPEAEITLRLKYELTLPKLYGWLAYTNRQLNLGDWYPFIPAYQPGQGWLVHNPGVYGEYLVYPAIDYTIDLELLAAQKTLVVAGPAAPRAAADGRYRFELKGGRGIALSISPEYQVLTDGPVNAYLFPEHLNAGKASLKTARDALDLYSQIFAPYPYPALSLVEADFFDGMEYSGLFFLGYDYFSAYPGTTHSYLTALSAHETAHQWWYGLVGDDPALEPWLDEAFCTYSELLYYQSAHPEDVDWWWYYRVDRFQPAGAVNSSIYDHAAFRPYVDAVYLQGARLLDDLRGQMGEDAFAAFLKAVIAQYRYGIVTTADVLRLAQEATSKPISELVRKYMKP